ncbi:hypothetical protein AB6M97_01865 [Streptococcus hillyeri]|uniref:hypothetical protein n=1 Tax=Streptococcus hillyeri TaxID=2282420 RepID=UPI0034E1AE2B
MEVAELGSLELLGLFIKSVVKETAEELKAELEKPDPEHVWYNQSDLQKELNISRDTIKKMERYGLTFHKEGKDNMYNLAEVNEVRKLMNIK